MVAESLPKNEEMPPLKRALIAIKDMRARMEAMEFALKEPIAVVGVACRFPGPANNPAAFWKLLYRGLDAVREVPSDRWDIRKWYDPDPEAPGKSYVHEGCFLESIDAFDAKFFGITPREAHSMDPMQRLLMEVSWEALENAAIAPSSLHGSLTGVFVGIGPSEYAQRQYLNETPDRIDAYVGTGNLSSIAAGRISFFLGLRGPSIAIDTACSSSLVTVDLAVQSLRTGKCNMALTGGVNLMISPESTVFLSKVKALSADGRCKTFDSAADGYGRGEGCGMIVLKRLSDAQTSGDRILGLILGSAVNHDGHSSGLTVPNGIAQQEVIRLALSNAGIQPSEMDYIEAHGTGTPLGDPIELRALDAVFGDSRSADRKLVVGTVKTNIGHLETAAGIAGMIKVVLAMQHGWIPSHLHMKQPNSHIQWEQLAIAIPTEGMSWPGNVNRSIAGVSSFGFSGTNAHVILQAAPKNEAKRSGVDRPAHILTLSAIDADALRESAARMNDYLVSEVTDFPGDICFTASAGRSHFSHRLAVIAEDTSQLAQQLLAFTNGKVGNGVLHHTVSETGKRLKIAFLFTGQGSQYVGMSRQLYETQPTFRGAMEACDEILRPYLKTSLIGVLYPELGLEASKEQLLDQTRVTQPALFALEYALAELWRSWGVEPSAVMGHSVGEYVAACIAGVFSLEDGLKLIAERGRLIQALPKSGAMAAVFADEKRVKQALVEYRDSISIAALNSPSNTVISGSQTEVDAIVKHLNAEGIHSQLLRVSHAFHSSLTEPMLPEFSKILAQVSFSSPRIKFVSNLYGKAVGGDEIKQVDYWCRHVRECVRFSDSIQFLEKQGINTFLEVGPHAVLSELGQDCARGKGNLWLASLRKGIPDWQQLLASLGALYTNGSYIDWEGFDKDYSRRKVDLPTYPFQRKRYWFSEVKQNLKHNVKLKYEDANRSTLPEKTKSANRIEEDINNWLYEVRWKKRRHEGEKDDTNQIKKWVIFADRRGYAEALISHMKSFGIRCISVLAGVEYRQLSNESYAIDPDRREDILHLLESISMGEEKTPAGWLYLWALDHIEDKVHSVSGLEKIHRGLCSSLLYLLQVLEANNKIASDQLWVVTCGAQSRRQIKLGAIYQSPLWGLGRAAMNEIEDLFSGLIDLDPEDPVHKIEHLVNEILYPDGEKQVVFQGNFRRVARLVGRKNAEPCDLTIHPDGSYLITGGTGGLGLRVSRWLAEQGARHLILVNRRLPSPAVRDEIKKIEETNAKVYIRQTDISQEEDVQSIFAEFGTQLPRLRGVIHLAGVIDDGLLSNQTWEGFSKVMAPKVTGGWVLHKATHALKLDFFILFSSTSSVMGSVGQANYASANAFLDTLAGYRRSLGLPGASINWGPWADVGMAANSGAYSQQRLNSIGIEMIPVEKGLALLKCLIQEGPPQVCVLRGDWSTYKSQFHGDMLPRFYNEIDKKRMTLPQDEQETEADDRQLIQFHQQAPELREVFLIDYLQNCIAGIINLDADEIPVEESFISLGVDSLMVMELINKIKRDFKLSLYAKEVFERASVKRLSAYLVTELAKQRKGSSSIVSTVRTVPIDLITMKGSEGIKRRWSGKKNSTMAFLLSSPRSGSTLLRVMLAGHPDLFCPPELHLLQFDNLRERQKAYGASYLTEGLEKAMVDINNMDVKSIQSRIRNWVRKEKPVAHVYQWLQESISPRLLIDKSPTYASDYETLLYAETLFHNPKYIFLVRHPYSVIESFVRNRMERLAGIDTKNPGQLAEQVWCETNANIIDFFEGIDSSRHHCVYYEELVQDPEKTMRDLCSFLNISFEGALLKPYEGSRMTEGLHRSSVGIGDPSFLEHKGIDPSLADAWKQVSLPRRLGGFARRVASEMGYELPWPTPLAQPETKQVTSTPPIKAILRDGELPLSFAQQRIWFLNQLEPNSPAMNMPAGAFRLKSSVNVVVLEQSLNEIIQRHEILRTTFVDSDGRPSQVINPTSNLNIPMVDLQSYPETKRETEARRLALEELRRPFDLKQGPLLRAHIFRLNEQEYLFLLVMHHIISDGWCINLLLDELAKLYTAFSAGQPSPLKDPPVQFVDYAAWQQQWFKNEVLETQLAYWKQKLDGAPVMLDLPTDHPRPVVQTFKGARHSVMLPETVMQAVSALCRAEATTPFMTMLAAVMITLFKWTEQDDIVLGTVFANRNKFETKDMIGCFINYLPLRSKISNDETGIQLLKQIKATSIEAYSHQDCPFEKLVEVLAINRSHSQNPLYNVAFLHQNLPKSTSFFNTLNAGFVPLYTPTSQLDLRIVTQELQEGTYLWCEYNTDLFEADTIVHLVNLYCDTLQKFVEYPEKKIAQFDIPEGLASQAKAAKLRELEQTFAIAATFTAEPVEKTLHFWQQKLETSGNITFAPYNQVFQQLLDPESLINKNKKGINILLVRFEDWIRYDHKLSTKMNGEALSKESVTPRTKQDKIEENVQNFARDLKYSASQSTISYLLCICPASPKNLADAGQMEFHKNMEDILLAEADKLGNVYIVTPSDLDSLYPVENYYDPDGDELGHIPYTPAFFVSLGTMITRRMHVINSMPYKVIVLDCDQTLWKGVCGEDGPLGISIDSNYKELQRFMVAQQEAGMLICLCSKNNEADVVSVFEQRPEMPLKREHITTWRINWSRKSENIKSLADELKLGLDSFIFIDDNPVECAEVETAHPEVLTLQLPLESETFSKFFQHTWAFDHLKTTEEDKKRTMLYKQNIQREKSREEAPTFKDFLAGLELNVNISKLRPTHLSRVAQLTQRTNQFNITTIRRSENEIQTLCREKSIECLVAEVSDRFGDYGLVGVMLFENCHDALIIDTFLLSCRVLGRGVEHQMLARLGDVAKECKIDHIEVTYIPTERNQPALDFLDSVGSTFKQRVDEKWVFRLPTELVSDLILNPDI